VLGTLSDSSVHCVVTSPPYYGLRDYGIDKQMGLEDTPDQYIKNMVAVFQEVYRVLRHDGTLWVNIGDSYAASGMGGNPDKSKHKKQATNRGSCGGAIANRRRKAQKGLKPKDIIGVPWMLAFALRDAGWYLRQDIIWHKPNPMPESVKDRCTKSHEHIFMLAKSAHYYYDAEAIRTPVKASTLSRINQEIDKQSGSKRANGGTRPNRPMKALLPGGHTDKQRGHPRRHAGFGDRWDLMGKSEQMSMGANARDVWSIATRPYKGAHFATFPPELAKRCILAGCPVGGVVLDPFAGSGTTAEVAAQLGMSSVLIELNPEYENLIRERCERAADKRGLFCNE